MNNELRHYGILGMKWGVHRSEDQLARARGEKPDNQKKKDIIKKVAAGSATVVTMSAATALYMKNKKTVDDFVKTFISNNKEVRLTKRADYANSHKEQILKSASKLNKYKDYYSEADVKDALKKLQTTRDLHQLSQDNIRRGANYVQAFLAYGTAATAAYNLKNTPLVKDMSNPKKSNSKKD